MDNFNIKTAALEEIFNIEIAVDKPIVIGQDDTVGKRQLIPILSGKVSGEGFDSKVPPGGIDSQVIRPDGKCELSARYAMLQYCQRMFYLNFINFYKIGVHLP